MSKPSWTRSTTLEESESSIRIIGCAGMNRASASTGCSCLSFTVAIPTTLFPRVEPCCQHAAGVATGERRSSMADPHPAYLAELTQRLGDFPGRYGKPTTEERESLRCTAPTADLEACHRAVSAELVRILEVLDQYDYREIPAEWQPIA